MEAGLGRPRPDRSINPFEKLDAAGSELRRQIELNPKNFRAHVLLGQICLEQHQTGVALQRFQEAHRLKADDLMQH
jgi:cytochrome c-type biogenesis protein CcmH/NrfG